LLDILNPPYPDPFLADFPTRYPQSVAQTRAAADLANPYLIHGSISGEKRFGSNLMVSASYDFIRGVHQIRTRNVNAPIPGTPFPFISPLTQFESAGSLFARALSLRFRGLGLRLPGVSVFVTGGYTLGSSEDDNSVPANPYDLRAEWAPSSNFSRHHVWSGVNAAMPWGLSTAVLFHGYSGQRYTITTGLDQNGDGQVTDRPAGIPRNSELGPHHVNFDAWLSKAIALPLRWRADSPLVLTVFVYGRNIMNETHHGRPSGVLLSPFFGRPAFSFSSRQMEVGGRLRF
jgi:hypothetical protein